jgi:fluoride exporter
VTWLLVAVAGAAGALCRYSIVVAVGVRPFPAATLVINVLGSFLLGLVLPLGIFGRLSPPATAAIAVGFLGAFTTYSTFSWELFDLGRTDRLPVAAAYLAVSVVAGVVAAGLGYRFGEMLSR